MEPVETKLTVRVARDPDCTPVITLDGELDLSTAPDAERAFAVLPAAEELAVANGSSVVVVDATDLTFMDSSGVTVLLEAVNRGYRLRLRRPSSIIRRLIIATGLTETLPVEDV